MGGAHDLMALRRLGGEDTRPFRSIPDSRTEPERPRLEIVQAAESHPEIQGATTPQERREPEPWRQHGRTAGDVGSRMDGISALRRIQFFENKKKLTQTMEKLEAEKAAMAQAESHIAKLEEERDRLEWERDALEESHRFAEQTLIEFYERRIAELEEKLEAEEKRCASEEDRERLRKIHQAEVEALRKAHLEQVEKLGSEHNATLEHMREDLRKVGKRLEEVLKKAADDEASFRSGRVGNTPSLLSFA